MRSHKVKHAKQLHHTRIPARTSMQHFDNRGVVRLKQDMVVLKVSTEDQGGENNRCQFFRGNVNVGRRRELLNLKQRFTPHCPATPASGRIRLHCNGREQATDSGQQTLTSSLDKSDPPPDIRGSLLVQPNMEVQLIWNRQQVDQPPNKHPTKLKDGGGMVQ